MKKLFMIMMMSALLAMPVMAQHHRGHYNNQSCEYRYGNKGRNCSYVKSRGEVFYNGKLLRGASASSFRDLGGGYAKDNFNVYYRGDVMRGASVNSFRVMKDGYAKDNFNTYYRGKRVR